MAARTLAPKTPWKIMRSCVAVLCSALLVPGDVVALASTDAIQSTQAPAQAAPGSRTERARKSEDTPRPA